MENELTETETETQEKLLWTVEDVISRLQIGKTAFYKSLKYGKFGPMAVHSFGRKNLFKPDEVKAWLAAGCPSRRNWVAMRGDK